MGVIGLARLAWLIGVAGPVGLAKREDRPDLGVTVYAAWANHM